MARMKKVQALVYDTLLNKPETRADDFILVLEVYKSFVSCEMSFAEVLEHHTALGLPSFASIARSRRKLQSKYPELVYKAAAEMRADEEKRYRAYALNS